MKRLLPLLVLLVSILSIPAILLVEKQSNDIRSRAAPATSLTVSPGTKTAYLQDGNFSLDILANSETIIGAAANAVTGFDLALTYDTRFLKPVDINLGNFFVDQSKVSVIAKTIPDSIASGTQGTIVYRFFTMQENARKGQGTVAVVTFSPLASGTTVVQVDTSRSKAIAIGEDGNILVSATGTTITLAQRPVPTVTTTLTPTVSVLPTKTPTLSVPSKTPTPTSMTGFCTGVSDGIVCPLEPCPSTTPCPTGTMCPAYVCTLAGVCKSGLCVPNPTPTCTILPPCAYEGIKQADGTILYCTVPSLPTGQFYCPRPTITITSTPAYTPTITPTPPPGCFYQPVTCVTAPCPPIVVCPTKSPTPTAAKSPTPTPTTVRTDDLFFDQPNTLQFIRYFTSDGKKTEVLRENLIIGRTYIVETQVQVQNLLKTTAVDYRVIGLELVVNSQFRGNGSLTYGLITQHTAGAGTTLSTTFVAQEINTISVALDTANSFMEAYETNNTQSAQVQISQQQTKPVTIKFKYTGVTGAEALGSKISVRFRKATTDLTTPVMTVQHIGSGIYQASFLLSLSNLTEGAGYEIILKGEKHIAKKFCVQTGQTTPCSGQTISLNFDTASWAYDFTGMPLEPGDLYPQDNRADGTDFDKIKALLGKTCSSLTVEEKLTGDLNYDGCVTVSDAFLMRKTLETRYDDN